MLLVLLLRRGGSRRALTLLSVLTVAGVTLVSVVALTDSTAFIQERAGSQSYDVDRFGAQRSGIALAAEHPVGVGPGQADVIIGRSTHSLYVRSLAEQGVIGLATILLLVTLTLFLAVRNVWLGRDTYGVGSAALLAAWCGLMASSLFVDTLHWRHLWIVAALIWVGATRPQRLGRVAGP